MTADVASSPRPLPIFVRPLLRQVSRGWGQGGLIIDLPGTPEAICVGGSGEPVGRLTLRRWGALGRLLAEGDLGFAEGYIDGDWETPDLAALLTVLAGNYDGLAPRGLKLLAAARGLVHALNRNDRRGARSNILSHSDLGNDFYRAWLDDSMTYSAALFDGGDGSLDQAQRRKYQRMAEIAGIGRDDHVLEIGCGWGGFAEYAAGELGAKVTAITLSPAQKAFAEARMFRAGLAERVEVRLVDYRDVEGRFDAVVSIEMFEAVGQAYWPLFFSRLGERLKPGAYAALQVIVIREDLFAEYMRRPDFIQLHIFPGGMLPTERRLTGAAEKAGLSVEPSSLLRCGGDYARTLADWRARFAGAWPLIARLGFDRRFERLWRYYLAYCEAGFRTGRTDVLQAALRAPG